MSIKKYEVLLQTADLGSFTKASEVLGYTQSAISHIVTGLEDELGLKLLTRDRFGVRLTPEGEALLRTSYMATHTDALLDEAMDIMAEVLVKHE